MPEAETQPSFLITQEWLAAEDACREGRALLGDRRLPIADAFALALDVDHREWCVWATMRLLSRVDCCARAGFAARRARSVQHLWTPATRPACEAAVAMAERVATTGEVVSVNEVESAAAACMQAFTEEMQEAGVSCPWKDARWEAAWSAAEAAWGAVTATREAAWAAAWSALEAAWAARAGGPRAERASWLEAAADLQAMLDAASR
jgi:hypothetical protein